MVTAILTILSSAFKLAVGLFRSNNTPDMIANAEAKRLQSVKDQVTSDVTSGNLDNVRDDLAQ